VDEPRERRERNGGKFVMEGQGAEWLPNVRFGPGVGHNPGIRE